MPHAPTVDRWLARLPQEAAWRADAGFVDKLRRLAVASDFAMATLVAQPGLIERLHADDGATPLPLPVLAADQPEEWPRLLRRYRHAVSTVLAWRDIVVGDPVEAIIAGSTALADACLRIALEALEAGFAARYGVVRDTDGEVQRLVVFGMGKLGGGELNFSSDIDLVYAYEREGVSDGARALDAQDYFARLGQQLAKLLNETTADGFCHRGRGGSPA